MGFDLVLEISWANECVVLAVQVVSRHRGRPPVRLVNRSYIQSESRNKRGIRGGSRQHVSISSSLPASECTCDW